MEGVALRSRIHPLRMEGQALRIPSLRIAWSEGLVRRIGFQFKLTPLRGGKSPSPRALRRPRQVWRSPLARAIPVGFPALSEPLRECRGHLPESPGGISEGAVCRPPTSGIRVEGGAEGAILETLGRGNGDTGAFSGELGVSADGDPSDDPGSPAGVGGPPPAVGGSRGGAPGGGSGAGLPGACGRPGAVAPGSGGGPSPAGDRDGGAGGRRRDPGAAPLRRALLRGRVVLSFRPALDRDV
jgi:hypothetical protein